MKKVIHIICTMVMLAVFGAQTALAEVSWIEQFGTGSYDGAYSVALDTAGAAYVGGTTQGDLDGARNALRIKALSPGWVRSFETRLAKAEVGSKAHEQFQTWDLLENQCGGRWLIEPHNAR